MQVLSRLQFQKLDNSDEPILKSGKNFLQGLRRIRVNSNYSKQFKNYQCVGIIQIDFSSGIQTIPMNLSEEKWGKPHFNPFLED